MTTMNEQKSVLCPIAWHIEGHGRGRFVTTYDENLANSWRSKGWTVTPHYLIVPDIYRIVSVELLEVFLTKADALHSEFGDDYQDDPDVIQLRAIIDKKDTDEN